MLSFCSHMGVHAVSRGEQNAGLRVMVRVQVRGCSRGYHPRMKFCMYITNMYVLYILESAL